ncbi:hypothetical protein LTR53_001448 [Teratosphaeriaceae sp. CCFEE 6253]|nr:hypothetical protein LTR53_001448 [Teratosphaeriaceae sp. CCFEE 6253]
MSTAGTTGSAWSQETSDSSCSCSDPSSSPADHTFERMRGRDHGFSLGYIGSTPGWLGPAATGVCIIPGSPIETSRLVHDIPPIFRERAKSWAATPPSRDYRARPCTDPRRSGPSKHNPNHQPLHGGPSRQHVWTRIDIRDHRRVFHCPRPYGSRGPPHSATERLDRFYFRCQRVRCRMQVCLSCRIYADRVGQCGWGVGLNSD